MKPLLRPRAGYTIIELLAYVAVSTVAILVFTAFTVDVVRHTVFAKARHEVSYNARFLMARMLHDIRQAKSVTFVSSQEILLVDKNDEDIRYLWNSDLDKLSLEYYNGTDWTTLSSDKVAITDLTFTVPNSDQVVVSLTVEQKTDVESFPDSEITLSSTAVRRLSLYQ